MSLSWLPCFAVEMSIGAAMLDYFQFGDLGHDAVKGL